MRKPSSSFSVVFLVSLVACGGDDFVSDENAGGSGGSSSQGGASGQSQAGSGGSAAGGSGQGGSGQSGAAGQAAGGQAGASAAGGTAGMAAGGSAGAAGTVSAGAGGAGAGGASGTGGAGGGGACSPGKFQCVGDLLQKCSAAGEWMGIDACGNGLCNEETGACLKCKPTLPTTCADDHTQNVCDSTGMSESPIACPLTKPHCVQGQCVDCIDGSDCPPSASACFVGACINNKCGVQPADSGTASSKQTAGDCKKVVCDGKGGTLEQADPSDHQPDDGNPCTAEICMGDMPTSSNVAPGTACSQTGVTGVCTGTGLCADCVPNTTRCTGNQLETCSPLGKWKQSDCDTATPVCSAGACVAVKQLAAGDDHTCAVLTDGTVRCWGNAENGQLGDGMSGVGVRQTRPVALSGLGKTKAVSLGGAHSCALLEDSSVACWGLNSSGQLGLGQASMTPQTTPSKVPNFQGVTSIDLGGQHSCAITDDGSLYCWGNNDHGQLGLGAAGPQASPQVNGAIALAKTVTAGGQHTCVTTEGGVVACWGSDSSGQLGNGTKTTADQYGPVQTGLVGVTGLGSGGLHSCAILSTKVVNCWGEDHQQQLGDSSGGLADVNQQSPSGTNFKLGPIALALGAQHTCVLLPGGSVQCAGANNAGQLGNGTNASPFPGQPADPSSVLVAEGTLLNGAVEIVAGGSHNCARLLSGQVVCWGSNAYGQLGTDKNIPGSGYPVPVAW